VTSSLDDRVAALESAVAAAEGRLRDDQLDPAREAISRVSVRLRKSAEHTIVVLGGATGSGKSSLFNALSGIDLAGVGIRRPTTAWTLACTWGPGDAGELLSWIGISPRHQLTRRGPLDDDTDASLDGLVLLDMPDHDSMVEAHQREVDRVVEFADLFIWVLDPQKYADAAIHDQYLAPLSHHRETTVVVMNQIDRLNEDDRDVVLDDLRKILDRQGLTEAPILATSASSGLGLDELCAEISRRVDAKNAASIRLAADVRTAAEQLAEAGVDEAKGLTSEDAERLIDAVTHGVGVDRLAEAARDSTIHRGTATTSWPPIALAARRRTSPFVSGADAASAPESELSVDRARAEQAIRQAVQSAADGAAEPWRASIARAASASGASVDRIDAGVRSVDVPSRSSGGWAVIGVLQWLLLIALVGGLGWLALAAAGVVEAPKLLGLSAALWLALVGAVGGLVLTLSARAMVRQAARRAAQGIEQRVRDAVEQAVTEEVLPRIEQELDAYQRFRSGVRDAVG